jgi:ATPase components of ABC transporters with duplicated ATPase domains
LFTGDDVFKLVSTLSGGEKGRLALAKLIYSGKNVLVLDEPTNHLDIPSREALENALAEYDGTVITVSHDRYFLDKIATQILSIDKDGTVDEFNGNYTEFHDWRAKADAENGRRDDAVSVPRAEAGHFFNEAATTNQHETTRNEQNLENPHSAIRIPQSDGSYLSKNQLARLQSRVKEIEREITVLEEKAAHLSDQMALPQIASDFGRLKEVTGKHAETAQEIQNLYSEWETITEQLG